MTEESSSNNPLIELSDLSTKEDEPRESIYDPVDDVVTHKPKPRASQYNIRLFEEAARNFPARSFTKCLRGHVGGVRAVTVYVDDDGCGTIATAGDDFSCITWDLDSYKLLNRLKLHTDRVRCLTVFRVSASNVFLITGSDDTTCGIWDLITGEQKKHLVGGHEWYITSVCAYNVDRMYNDEPFRNVRVVTASFEINAVIWDAHTGQPITRLSGGHLNGVLSITVTWDYETDPKKADKETLSNMAKIPLLVTGGFDRIGVVWSGLTGKELRKLEGGHSDIMSSVAVFTPTHNAFTGAAVSGDSSNDSTTNDSFSLSNIGPTPLVVTGSYDRTIGVWNLRCGWLLQKFSSTHEDWVNSLLVFPSPMDGRPLLFTGSQDKTAMLWDLQSGNQIRKLENQHRGAITSVAVVSSKTRSAVMTSKSGRQGTLGTQTNLLLLTAGEDGSTIIMDLTSEQERKLVEGHTHWITSLAIYDPVADSRTLTSPRSLGASMEFSFVNTLSRLNSKSQTPTVSKTALIISSSADKTICIWNLFTGKVIRKLEGGHTESVCCLKVFLPDQDLSQQQAALAEESRFQSAAAPIIVSAGYDRMLCFWNLFSGELLRRCDTHHTAMPSCIDILYPDGSGRHQEPYIVTGSFDRTLSILRYSDGQLVRRLVDGHTDFITGACIYRHAEGAWIVSVGTDHMVTIWDFDTGNIRCQSSEGHSERIKTVAICEFKSSDPVFVTGSYDKTAVIWDLKTCKVLRRLVGGHHNWVTSVAICCPCGTVDRTFVITGGFDGVAALWDFTSGTLLRKIEGAHKDSIRCIACYVPKDGKDGMSSPLIVTGSGDASIAISDSLFPFNYMPPCALVKRHFLLDMEEILDKTWPRIRALSKQYGARFWMENPELYYEAMTRKRQDFFLQFRDALRIVITLYCAQTNRQSVLRYAIVNKELEVVQVALQAWIANLNTPLSNAQICPHPSYLLPKDEVLLLAKHYPAEFCSFICSLRLVRWEMSETYLCHINDESRSVVIAGENEQDSTCSVCKDLMKQVSEESPDAHPVALQYVPLLFASDISMIAAYVTVSESLDSVEIFNSEVGMVALRHAWESFGQKTHWKSTYLFALFLAEYTIAVFIFQLLAEYPDNQGLAVIVWLTQALCLSMIGQRCIYEYRKITQDTEPRALQRFFSDFWNIIDTFSITLISAGLLLRCAYMGETVCSRSLLALTSVSIYFKSLYFLRPLPASGPLVSMVVQIAFDIRFFLVVLLLVLAGFSLGFWLLSYPSEDLPFGTIQRALFNCFLYMLGNFDGDFSGTASPNIATILLVLFLLFMTILMLNLLIALMGQSFTAVSEKGLAQWRMEQASIMIDEKFVLSDDKLRMKPCVYVLKYAADVDKDEKEATAEERAMEQFNMLNQRLDKLSSNSEEYKREMMALDKKFDGKIVQLEEKMDGLCNKLDRILQKLNLES